MPRVARLDSPGLLQHVIVRGIEKRRIFLDDQDRGSFLDRLSTLLKETETNCYAWALLPNHFHLLLIPTRYPLALLMRRLLTGYAVNFNLRHKRVGHLFQNRYKSIVCEEEPYLLELIRYIHLNPLRAGLVNVLEELDRYPWSGHVVLLGKGEMKGQVVEEVLQLFATKTSTARKKYLEFIAAGISRGRRENLVGGGLKKSQALAKNGLADEAFDSRVLGSGEFVERLQEKEELKDIIKASLPLSALVERVSSFFDLQPDEICRPRKVRFFAEIRGVVCYLGVRVFGYKGLEIGKMLCLGAAGVSIAARRGEVFLKENPGLKEKIISIIDK